MDWLELVCVGMSIRIQVNDLAIKINLNDYKVNLHKSYQLLVKSFELSFFSNANGNANLFFSNCI